MEVQQVDIEEIQQMLEARDFMGLRNHVTVFSPHEIADLIDDLPSPDDVAVFRLLPRRLATETFEHLPHDKQETLIDALFTQKRRLVDLLNDMSPDDRTALLEELPGHVAQKLLNMLKPEEREIAVRLLGYPEDSIGRLMTTDYVAVRSDWTVGHTLEHIRRFGKDSETLNVIYVINENWELQDDLRIRELLLADPESRIGHLCDGRFIALKALDDQEAAVALFRDIGRTALPVTDSEGILLGIVTVDDVLVVAEEEATEDIQKIGGQEALDDPYLSTPVGMLIKKRARWLVVLFLGEMLTATAMSYFEQEIARAVVLALFVPLIISSGGNSGSQAATLVVRALAVGEITLSDWWDVMRREIISGLSLGGILGIIGMMRIIIWDHFFGTYGAHSFLIGLAVGLSLVGVVLWGTLSGSMLPFVMKRLGADPATSSTPFVATLVDVTGLVIYFSVAALILTGTIL